MSHCPGFIRILGTLFILKQQQFWYHTSTRLDATRQHNCCMYRRKKRLRTSPHTPGPWPGALTTASAGEGQSGGYEPSIVRGRGFPRRASSRWGARMYPYHSLLLLQGCGLSLLIESRHNPFDSTNTIVIWVRSPLVWGRKSCARGLTRKRSTANVALAGRCWVTSILTLLCASTAAAVLLLYP